MELRTFIKEALVQIASGIEDANKELIDIDATVNPMNVNVATKNAIRYGYIDTTKTFGRSVEKVKFNVAVTVTDGTHTKGGIGVTGGLFAVGSQGESKNSNTSQSNLQFEIPIVLPNGSL